MSNKLNKKPVNGMKDVLPREMEIRSWCMKVIRENYKKYGFTEIETPCVESIENLSSKQGGENEKLIFKILKRGEKLSSALMGEGAKEENNLADSGLRYDLTLPLSRYYANHANELPSPFKALQMGNVFRADRPQKGRFRQFMQCDIDILGEPSNLAEIELILATTSTLKKLGFNDFTVRINERRILRAMAISCGFEEDRLDGVYITLDKMDKIGLEGVESELKEDGFSEEAVSAYVGLLDGLQKAEDPLAYLKEKLGESLEEGVCESLAQIKESVLAAGSDGFEILFDPTLVRGMGYYTGTIFEIEMKEFGSSVAGGGRYDKMVGRFTGNDTPACGFSIGFERIITILLDKDFKIPDEKKKVAFLLEKGLPTDKLAQAISLAQQRRDAGEQVLMVRMNKNKKFQKQQLEGEGYEEFVDFYREALKN
ncbi:MAG: histidine--tRNA ligase [Lachnospiraceae bacterium]|nr:histidine--tRNA ligase [Lachnospiraceae bacterium]